MRYCNKLFLSLYLFAMYSNNRLKLYLCSYFPKLFNRDDYLPFLLLRSFLRLLVKLLNVLPDNLRVLIFFLNL